MKSVLWKKNDAVRNWLNNKWLCIPQVCSCAIVNQYRIVQGETLVNLLFLSVWRGQVW